jgi:hypothetical protein
LWNICGTLHDLLLSYTFLIDSELDSKVRRAMTDTVNTDIVSQFFWISKDSVIVQLKLNHVEWVRNHLLTWLLSHVISMFCCPFNLI